MNKQIHIGKSFLKTGLQIMIFFIVFIFQKEVSAQIAIDSSQLILYDTLKFDSAARGIFNKIIKPIKFKSNRNNKENERIYRFMLERIKTGDLNIDTTTVNQIMYQLNVIGSASDSNKASIDGINLELVNKSKQKSIDDIITKNKLDEKASKEVVDSLKTQMSAVVQENATIDNLEKRKLLNKANDLLKEIRIVKYSGASNLAALDSIKTGSTIIRIKRWLNSKTKIIGWHYSWIEDEYSKYYNYNYLSAINLYGYELSVTGKTKKPEFLIDFQKPGGVIKTAQEYGCEVHLTVYNKLPAEITKFLNNRVAQDTLFAELNVLIKNNNLKGINIYFESINGTDSKSFVQFISKLYNNLKRIDNTIELNITIPAVSDDASIKEISAYNFAELNSMVDYYLVLTDRIIGNKVNFAQSASPLFNSNKYGNRSIESTINFYSNASIPIQKLIMSVSYLGVEWPVKDFSGTLESNMYSDKKYAEIIDIYRNNEGGEQIIAEGFDPDQVSAFLNITGKNPDDKKQIWFEDSRSLFLKYNWALENGLGGVSVRGLGYDKENPELWAVLGAALIKIDTTFIDTIHLIKPEPEVKTRFPIIVNAWHGFKWQTFKQDLKWARTIRLKYNYDGYDNGVKVSFLRFDSKINKSVGSIKDTIAEYIDKKIIWKEAMPFEKDSTRNYEAYLKNKSYCYSLYTRWTIYAKFSFWCSIAFFVLTILLYFVSFNLERYILGSEKSRRITRNMPSILFFLTLFLASFWLFFDPSFENFGAGSEEGTESLIMVYTLLFGIVFGWIVSYRYYKYKGS